MLRPLRTTATIATAALVTLAICASASAQAPARSSGTPSVAAGVADIVSAVRHVVQAPPAEPTTTTQAPPDQAPQEATAAEQAPAQQAPGEQTPAQDATLPDLLPPPDPAPKPIPKPTPPPTPTPKPTPTPTPVTPTPATPSPVNPTTTGPSPADLAAEKAAAAAKAAQAALLEKQRVAAEKARLALIEKQRVAAERLSAAVTVQTARSGHDVLVGSGAVLSASKGAAAATIGRQQPRASATTRDEGGSVIDTRIAAFVAMLLLAVGLVAVSSGRRPSGQPRLATGGRTVTAGAGSARRTATRRPITVAAERFLADRLGEITVTALAILAILVTIYLVLNPGFFFQ